MSTDPHRRPTVVEGDVVPPASWSPRRPQHPPARRSPAPCRCGKRDRAAHGGFSCNEVLASAARVEAAAAASTPRFVLAAVGVLAGLAAAAGVVWLVVLGVTAVVSAVITAAAWLAEYWPVLAIVALVLVLLLAGRKKCAGLHCGGCKG